MLRAEYCHQPRRHGFTIVDKEPPPPGLTGDGAKQFGYTIYSARYGNIYTARHLLQLTRECVRRFSPAEAVWEKDNRFYDAMRPSVEPFGLNSAAEVLAQRKDHLVRTLQAFRAADLFIFTFGLTEFWVHAESGTVYPTAPGTIAGDYDPTKFAFKNFKAQEIYADFCQFLKFMKRLSPNVKFLITVSPVPLTATAADNHVLVATTYSKSVLRAVAGQLAEEFNDVDYFPSYEIIATPFTGRLFYDANLRNVAKEGIDTVMRVFFKEHAPANATIETPASSNGNRLQAFGNSAADDLVCEESILEAFVR